MRRALIAILSLCLPLAAKGGDWAPIPAEVWQMKAADPGNELGAVFLDDEIRLGNRDTEYRLRIRIMSEPGKAAARMGEFPVAPLLDKLEGRTVYPDGRVVTFDSVKDFGSQTVKTGGFEESRKVLIPPGLTDNCVVDLHWSLSKTLVGEYDGDGNYFGDRWMDEVVPRDFPIRHKVIQLSRFSPMSSVVVGIGSHPPLIEKKDPYRVYTFDNVPAFEDIPYSVPITRERATLFLYWQPSALATNAKNPSLYWSDWAKHWLSKWFGDGLQGSLKAGRKYRAYLAKISEGLPSDPIQKAQAVVAQIQKDILNVDELTAEQAKARTKSQAKETIDADDLNDTVSNGYTNSSGISELAFKAFQDLGLHPKLVYVVDRNKRLFHSDLPCIYQFSDYFITVSDSTGAKTAWFDPGELLLPLGVIPSMYQATPALEINPADWSVRNISVPLQGAEVNRRTFTYDLAVEEGHEAFKMNATFSGLPLWWERDRFYRLEPAEQEKTLKESFQASLGTYQITQAHVASAQDLSKTTAWSVEGGKDLDEGRRVMIPPFPGMDAPYWVPSSWPDTRTTLIALPYAVNHSATSVIHVPAGYKVVTDPDMDERNEFGSVSWKTVAAGEGEGKTVTVQYKVEAFKALSGTTGYESFKTFLAWVEQAYGRQVALQKER